MRLRLCDIKECFVDSEEPLPMRADQNESPYSSIGGIEGIESIEAPHLCLNPLIAVAIHYTYGRRVVYIVYILYMYIYLY